jgi:pyrroline-5-carboxylate reductase
MVTSPGGTTEEGLIVLEEGGLRALLAHAVIATYEKAKVLGGK